MNKIKLSIIYSYFVRILTIWMPNFPIFRRFRGWLYSFMLEEYNGNFEVSSNVIITTLAGLRVKRGVRIAPNVVITSKNLTIGEEVIIGPNTVIIGGNHIFDGKSFRNNLSKSKGSIIIDDGSWVGANCTILSGSVLPKHSILAAGAVLNKPFTESNALYGGVPAKLIKSNIN